MKACAGLAALLLIAVPAPAIASGTVDCEAVSGSARLVLTVGSLPVLSVARLEIEIDDRIWSTGEGGDVAMHIAQAFRDGDRWLIDATDPNVEAVIAEIRLNAASEGHDTALAGTLKIVGTGAYAIACVGP